MKIWDIIKLILFIPVAYWWCDIHPDRNYDWLDGIWHGANVAGNFILSIFSDAIVKSQNGTLWYNIWWWFVVGFQILFVALGIVGYIFGFKNADDDMPSEETQEPKEEICEGK